MTLPDERPLTVAQLAEHWGCSDNHVRNLINRGELRAFRLGRRLIRIPTDAVAEYEQCATTGSQSMLQLPSDDGTIVIRQSS